MAGYSKLDCGIIHSTVWQEPHDVRVTWITLLAMSDAGGYVRAAIPALAKVVDVTVPRMVEIIALLCSTDPYSRTKSNDGRRLEEVDGGWKIINYSKYREGLKQPDNTNAERQKRHRERNASTVTHRYAPLRAVTRRYSNGYAEAEAEAEAEALNTKSPPPPLKGGLSVNDDAFTRFWNAYPKKVNKGDAKKAWDTGKCQKHIDTIINALEKHKVWHEWTKENGKFIPYPATWLRRLGWENELEITGLQTPGMAVGSEDEWK